MRNLKYTAVLAAAALAVAALFAACSTDPVEEAGGIDPTDPTPIPPQSDLPIRLNIKDVTSRIDTRNLIGNDRQSGDITDPNNPDYLIPLSEACRTDLATDPLKENGFAVGLFGDYYYVENPEAAHPDTVRVQDLYRGARLVYYDEVKDGQTVPKWDTNVAAKYWHPGAHYIFRAYYPQRMFPYTISNSNATTLAMVYPSRKKQFDLLLGCVPVEATNEQMKKAVDLRMGHALAAMRFEFKLNFAAADFLTSVYLLNDEERHFFTQGTVTYGSKTDPHSLVWLQDYNPPADEELYKWVPPLKYWYGVDKDGDGVIEMGEDKDGDGVIEPDETEELSADEMLKKWSWGVTTDEEASAAIGTPDQNPVMMFSNAVSPGAEEGSTTGGGSTSGGGNTSGGDNTSGGGNTTGGGNTSGGGNTTGGGNTSGGDNTSGGNNTPVVYTGKFAKAYYGMEDYYDEVAKKRVDSAPEEVAVEGKLYCRNASWVLIPPQESFGKLTLCFTTKKGDKAVYKVVLPKKTGTLIDKDGKVMKDAAGKFITESTEGRDAWVAGVRYTYLVTLSETNLGVDLTIEPWNERKHSTEIIF